MPRSTQCSRCPMDAMPGQGYCRPCHAEYSREWRKTKKGPSKTAVKHAARMALNYALRSGEVARGPCVFCGSTEQVEAHHEDYARPLDVVWVCRPHHVNLTYGSVTLPL